MKRRVLSFLAGAAAALALTALTATALAASGQVQFNFAGVALNGETKIAAGSDITAPNGQRVPGSILYVDEAGGKTNYLPIRTISELLGVKVGYDSATRTVLLGEQTAPASAAVASGLYWHRETDEDGVTYASEDPGIDYTEAPGYALTKLPEGWGLESVRAGMGGRGNLSYRNGSGGRISFSCAYPDGGSYGWSPGSGEIPCRTVTVNGHDAALYTYSSEYGDSCLLVWEDEAGVLFWFTGSDVDPDTLVEAASSVEPTSKTAPACEADWLPGGYSWFETNASGGAAETTWVGQGGNITLTCSATPLLMPEGDGETVHFGGVTARFWEAEKPHEAETDAWEPETVGGVIISSGTISGPQAADVATLAWTDGGLNFRLHGTVDQENLLHVAESLRIKLISDGTHKSSPGVQSTPGLFCQQLWPQLQVKRVVTYRRKKQRMPPAIRARKAQHSAAPMWSPTPEAVERAVISAVSSAPRAPTAEASPQQSQASARAGVRSASRPPSR